MYRNNIPTPGIPIIVIISSTYRYQCVSPGTIIIIPFFCIRLMNVLTGPAQAFVCFVSCFFFFNILLYTLHSSAAGMYTLFFFFSTLIRRRRRRRYFGKEPSTLRTTPCRPSYIHTPESLRHTYSI